MNRRDFLSVVGTMGTMALVGTTQYARSSEEGHHAVASTRLLTHGPKFHWAGYYDHLVFDTQDRYVVCHEVDFEHRSPRPDDQIKVGLVDTTKDSDNWEEIGSSCSWNWQQGCMLQWVPGREDEVIWNDREGDHYIARMYNRKTEERRTLPGPVYALSPDGKFALYPDFSRLADMRPGYGYAGVADPYRNQYAPSESGIWKMDLETGERQLLFSFADIVAIPTPGGFPEKVKHWFNHLIVSPDGQRFLFLHRWQTRENSPGWFTRLITAGIDGSDPFVVNAPPMTSHLVWRDSRHIIAFAHCDSNGHTLYIFEDKASNAIACCPDIKSDTHVSFVPGTDNQWILNDCYPRGKERMQDLFLVNLQTQRRIDLASFHLPAEYAGEWRIDLHPRCSRTGKKILVDIAEPERQGRQLCLIDLDSLDL
ncbi:MAG: hypothetical protein Q4G68_08715 [Planctomycetia bacterium]|nr:hypothetical protein [Planctomycetia bacterium]